METDAINLQFNENNCLDELEKLKNANKLAQQLLMKHPTNIVADKVSEESQPKDYEDTRNKELRKDERCDNWGASEYLQRSNFKYVDDYLCRTQHLLKTSSFLQKFPPSPSYEVVSSTEELFQKSNSQNTCATEKKNIENFSVSLVSNDSDIFVDDFDQLNVSCNSPVEECDAELILRTHRPNQNNLRLPVFDPHENSQVISETSSNNSHHIIPSDRNSSENYFFSDPVLPILECFQNTKSEDESTNSSSTSRSKNNFKNQFLQNREEIENNDKVSVISNQSSEQDNLFKLEDKTQTQCYVVEEKSNNILSSTESEIHFIPPLDLKDIFDETDNDSIASYQNTPKKKKDLNKKIIENVHQDRVFKSNGISLTKFKQPATTQVSSSTSKRISDTTRNATIFNTSKNLSVKLPSVMLPRANDKLSRNKSGLERNKILCQSLNGCFSLPDELLLHIFNFLSISDLLNVAKVCKFFYRVANDSCLWKFVAVSDICLNDQWFADMAVRNPKSLTLTRCDGGTVSNLGLRNFFKNCKTSLEGLEVENCSGKYLSGDAVLLHASCHCRSLTSVGVPWSKTTDNGLIAIAVALPVLRNVNINGNSSISDEAFHILSERHARYLTRLEMSGCFAVSSEVLLKLIESTTNLKVLNIGLCSKLTSDCIIRMCLNLRSLELLDLRGIKSVNNHCLHAISRHCEKLKSLIISNCSSVTDVGVAEIATYCSCLSHLDVSGCSQITDSGLINFITSARDLEFLDLSSTGATHKTVDFIATNNCLDLKTLKLSFCHNITSNCLISLLQISVSLKSLHLYGCKRLKLSQLIKINNNVVIEK